MNKYAQFSKVEETKKGMKRWSMCESKRTYYTEAEAMKGWNGRVYKCDYCKKFHRASCGSSKMRRGKM
jgi:hypothetical protein